MATVSLTGHMLLVDNEALAKEPSEMSFGFQPFSGPDAGRDSTGYMWANIKGTKITISLGWINTTPAETKDILSKFAPEYINVTFIDPRTDAEVTKEFYTGAKTAPIRIWAVGLKRYQKISFNIIER